LSEGSTELRSGDLDHDSRFGGDDDDDVDDPDGSAETTAGTCGTGAAGSNGTPESSVRLEPMDDVRGREAELRGSGEDGRARSLSYAYAGGTNGGSGRRLGVRIRTLREGLAAAVSLDVLPDGVGEGACLGEVRVGDNNMGGGDGVVCLGGGSVVDFVDWPASGSFFSNSGRSPPSPVSLFRTGPAAPAGAASRTTKGVADEAKFGDICRISSIDPMSTLPLDATTLSF